MPQGSEIPLPTEADVKKANETKELPLLRKIGKKLMTSGQIAMLSAVLATACDKAEKNYENPIGNFNTPQAQETLETHPTIAANESDFFENIANVKSRIKTEVGEENSTIEALSRYEKIYKNIDKLFLAYETNNIDGEPILLRQQKELFGDMDLSPIWKGKYKTEEEFLQDQIFFIHDKNTLQETISKLSAENPDNKEVEETIARSLTKLRVPDQTYLGMETKAQSGWVFKSEISPEIHEQLSSINPISEVSVRYATEEEIQKYNIRGAIFTPYPQEIVLNPSAPPETVVHEAGHAMDLVENPNILEYVNAEKAIGLLEARNKAILETRQWDNYEKIYSDTSVSAKNKMASNEPLNEEEIDYKISFLTNTIIVSPKERGTPFSENIFAKYLKSESLNNFKENGTPYLTNTEFMEKEAENLTQIARENPYLGLVIGKIKAEPSLFENYYGGKNSAPLPGLAGRPAKKYYDTLETAFAPTVLTTMLFENDPKLMELLQPGQYKEVINDQLTINKILEREQIAEIFYEAKIEGKSNTAREYAANLGINLLR